MHICIAILGKSVRWWWSWLAQKPGLVVRIGIPCRIPGACPAFADFTALQGWPSSLTTSYDKVTSALSALTQLSPLREAAARDFS